MYRSRLAAVVGVLLALALLVWSTAWWLPPLVRSQIETRGSLALGRPVTLGVVAFDPWRLTWTLSALQIGAAPAAPMPTNEPPAAQPLLKVGEIRLDLSLRSILRGAPVIESLDITGMRLQIARLGEGRYDVDDLIARVLAPTPDTGEPPRFALRRLRLHDASVRFDDRPLALEHLVDRIDLELPFLSSLRGDDQQPAEPHLVFRLDGTPFDSRATATPFAADRRALLGWKFTDFDLAPWRVYLPQALPVKLVHGLLSTDLQLDWEQSAQRPARLALRGSLALRDLDLRSPADRPLLAWRQARLQLHELDPLAQRVELDAVEIDGADIRVERDAAGRLAWQGATLPPVPAAAQPKPTTGAPSSTPAVGSAAVAATPPPSAVAAAASPASAPVAPMPPMAPKPATPPVGWQARVDAIRITDAALTWRDATVQPAATARVAKALLTVRDLRWPAAGAFPVTFSATLLGADPADAGTVRVEGDAGLREARLAVVVDALAPGILLPPLAAYLQPAALPSVQGRLSAQARIDWSADAPRLTVDIEQSSADLLAIKRPTAPVDDLACQRLVLAGAHLDALGRRLTVSRIDVVKPSLALERDAQGLVFLAGYRLPGGPAPSGSAASPEPPTAPPTARPTAPPTASPTADWQLQLAQLQIDGGRIHMTDATIPRGPGASQIELAEVRVGVQGFGWPLSARALKTRFSARLNDPTARQDLAIGIADWQGDLALAPLRASGRVHAVRLPLHLLAPYLAMPLRVMNAEAGFDGSVTLAQGGQGASVGASNGLNVSANGKLLLGDVQIDALDGVESGSNGEPLLSWQALSLDPVELAIKPGAAARLAIGEAVLSELGARLIITEQGRFRLPGLSAPVASAAASGSASAPASAPASAAVANGGPSAVTPSAAASSASGTPPPAALPWDLRVGGIALHRSRIDFEDHFIRPNYSAALTELEGRLGGFDSASRAMAALELRGKAAGTALLEITGAVNPGVDPLALDIQASATDLELPPLSPYAGKYAGYAIDRGKLSVVVAYKIDADGRLQASNRLTLNQLSFGDRIESPSATTLPVRFALALLKDRNGVVDINLPISGSVSDPQFSVGGIVVELILKLIVKAITAPFALFSGGSGDELSLVEFRPGSALIADTGHAALAKVAKALADRPALKMTVTGAADPAAEHDAVQRARLEARLRTEQRREALRGSLAASAPAAAPPAGGAASEAPRLAGADRDRALLAVYRQTDIPDKPRNRIGFLIDPPPAQAESMLLKQIRVTEADLRELALQRGLAVRDALIAKGLPSARLFVAAPKLHVSGGDEEAPAAAGSAASSTEPAPAWTPRVELSLTMD